MRVTMEYVALTILALTLTALVIFPIAEAASQSIINTTHCIEQPVNCANNAD